MSTTASTDVSALVEQRVKQISDSGEDVTLAAEAADLVEQLRREDPDALIAWFSRHAASLIREQLQTRLALVRTGGRAGAFEAKIWARPLDRRYSVEGNLWRRIGDMTKPDWKYLASQRAGQATASLFDIALARRVMERLPDDETPTRAVMGSVELLELEEQAALAAEHLVGTAV